MKVISNTICDDGMASVIPPCKTGTVMGGGAKDVNEFAFACDCLSVWYFDGIDSPSFSRFPVV